MFDPSGQSDASMAVKLALGETYIIQQTKQMLAEEVGNFLLGYRGMVHKGARLTLGVLTEFTNQPRG